jgi:enoyl-CoA hydratase
VSGADISQFEKARSTAQANAEYDRISERANKVLAECRKPTIAMIRGFCIGGGLAIAIGCDIRIATEESRFGIPAARLGVGYGAAGVKKLVDLTGPAYTKEIFLTARHFNAHEARQMGLVNRIVPDAELEDYIRKYFETISDNAPLTMLALKTAVGEILRGHEADWALCDRLVTTCFDSQDFIEGRRAFMEKRRPIFRGN